MSFNFLNSRGLSVKYNTVKFFEINFFSNGFSYSKLFQNMLLFNATYNAILLNNPWYR